MHHVSKIDLRKYKSLYTQYRYTSSSARSLFKRIIIGIDVNTAHYYSARVCIIQSKEYLHRYARSRVFTIKFSFTLTLSLISRESL